MSIIICKCLILLLVCLWINNMIISVYNSKFLLYIKYKKSKIFFHLKLQSYMSRDRSIRNNLPSLPFGRKVYLTCNQSLCYTTWQKVFVKCIFIIQKWKCKMFSHSKRKYLFVNCVGDTPFLLYN